MSLLKRSLLAAAALAALPALADPPAPGCWTGAVLKKDGKTPDYSVDLLLARTGGILHFGPNRSCGLKVAPKGASGDATYYALTPGTCTDLFDTTLKVRTSDNAVTFSIENKDLPETTLTLSKDDSPCLTR